MNIVDEDKNEALRIKREEVTVSFINILHEHVSYICHS